MAGLKILPIRKKSIEKTCSTTFCKKQMNDDKKKEMTYPLEYFLIPTITEDKKTS